MKRCPECRRDYADDSLNYCLDDGVALLDGPATLEQATLTSPNELRDTGGFAATARFSGDQPTEIFGSNLAPTIVRTNSIAVLPFANISKDEDVEYFSDGLAEELLNVLSKIRGIRVAARTSAFSFKGKPTTVGEIGRVLNVRSIVEGSIRMVGERIRIAVQLVNVSDGFQIWSETYDRDLDDIFAIQDDIAQSVVEELRTLLLGEESREDVSKKAISEVAAAVRGRPSNAEALRLMLLGRYLLDRTTRNDTSKAIDYFQQAIDMDPGFALGWAELGRAYAVEAGRGWVNVDEGFDRSRDATKRALELEPDLAEGHAQMGRIKAVHDWDLTGAEESYGRALELAPGSLPVLDGASVLAYKLGQFDRAIDLSREVLAQDPLSAAFWHNLGLACHAADRLKESEEAFSHALELAPQRFVSAALLALVLLDEGRTEDAIEQAENEADEFWRTWSLTIIHAVVGNISKSDEFLNLLADEYTDGNAYQIAEVYSMRNENDGAFEWLERAVKEKDPGVTHAKVNPRFRPLRNDPRWPKFVSDIGL